MSDVPEGCIRTIRRAAAAGVSTGRDYLPAEALYYRRCTHLHWRSGALVMFTRDTGHHSSGWMKNPDFERCLHVSISFRQPRPLMADDRLANAASLQIAGGYIPLAPFDPKVARAWVQAILGDAHRLAWLESAKSAKGKLLEVSHWRVFCDGAWGPIRPRGDVYSRELTEKGWQSWSEQHAEPNWISAE